MIGKQTIFFSFFDLLFISLKLLFFQTDDVESNKNSISGSLSIFLSLFLIGLIGFFSFYNLKQYIDQNRRI